MAKIERPGLSREKKAELWERWKSGQCASDIARARERTKGYVDGKNVRIEARWAEGHMDDLPQMAIELVRSKPDIILARGGRAPLAVQQATKVIPIVGVATTDPISNKNVASLAR